MQWVPERVAEASVIFRRSITIEGSSKWPSRFNEENFRKLLNDKNRAAAVTRAK